MSRELPPLHSLRVFDVTARCRSFSQAAEQLCLTQGAVSRQIQSLEDYFGFALFVRHPRKPLALTPEALVLAPTVRESLRALEEVTQRLTRRASGLTLKIPTCAMRWMLPKIMGFRSVEAEVDIQLTTTLSHSVDFDSEPFDAAVVYGERAARGYAQRGALFAEVLTPVCAPALAKRLRTPADLDKHTLLHPTRDHADWRRWLDAAGATKVRADLGQNFETMDLAVYAAVHGFGVAIGDRLLSDEEVAAGRLVRPFELAVATGEHYFLVVPERSLRSTKVMRFRDWLLEQQPIPTPTPEHSR